MVLVSLANHAGGEPMGDPPAWESWPGVTLIGTEAGLRRDRTTSDVLTRLVEQGIIERLLNAAPDGRLAANRRTNLYRIMIDAGEACGRLRCAWCGPARPVAERPPKHPGRGAPANRGNADPEAADLGGPEILTRPGEGRRRATTKPTTKDPTQNPKTPGPLPGAGGLPETPQADLVLQPSPPKAERKQATAPEARPHSAMADSLARSEWDRLSTKPVAGFLALRARVEEALDAGYSEAELARALPQIKAFTRNGFDLVLRQTRPQPDTTLDEGRELPSGEVQL